MMSVWLSRLRVAFVFLLLSLLTGAGTVYAYEPSGYGDQEGLRPAALAYGRTVRPGTVSSESLGLIAPVDHGGMDDPDPAPAPQIPVIPQVSPAPAPLSTSDDAAPVDLAADSLTHDEATRTITASGHVELIQAGRILRADEVSYNLETDTVVARGHVVLNEPSGDVHFAEEVELTDKMRTGFVKTLETRLAEGGRFTALTGERTRPDGPIVMQTASYTPCDCQEEGETPGWCLKADEVTYDRERNQIRYKNAKFELFGIPVLYTPYLAHPDGQIKRKSGFLTPGLNFDSELGTVVTPRYYWDIAPNRDLTVGAMLATEKAPVALAEYRHRFTDAEIRLDGSATYSSRTDSIAGRDVPQDEEFRGHLFANGRWDINQTWRAGTNIKITSDDQYLRQYNFASTDVLENELYLERFSGRNYAVGRILSFQDTRIREEQTDQPGVLPELDLRFVGDPNALLGGRWNLNLSALNLQRDGSGQDMSRVVAEAGWEKRYVTGGLLSTIALSARGDAYQIHDRDLSLLPAAASGTDAEETETRAFARAHMTTSYPLVRAFERMQAVIEPVAALTIAPVIAAQNNAVPNEDSQDVQLDASNLFNADRFPGMDRIEDGSRATYGLRTGLYGYQGSYLTAFAGQSRRFDQNDNPFPGGSGLSRQESDIVGQLAAQYDGRFGADYRFQIDSAQLDSQRHELDAYGKWGRLRLDSRYLFAKGLEGTDLTESREQILGAAAFDLTKNWTLRGGALYDLGESPGLRKALLGIDYLGCCVNFSLAAERSLTRDSSGDRGTDIMLRMGLKNIGDFQTSGSGDWTAGNHAK